MRWTLVVEAVNSATRPSAPRYRWKYGSTCGQHAQEQKALYSNRQASRQNKETATPHVNPCALLPPCPSHALLLSSNSTPNHTCTHPLPHLDVEPLHQGAALVKVDAQEQDVRVLLGKLANLRARAGRNTMCTVNIRWCYVGPEHMLSTSTSRY